MDSSFGNLVWKVRDKKALDMPDDIRLLCFDPGHTTGWAFFKGVELEHAGEIDTTVIKLAVDSVETLFAELVPNAIVMEDYRVYKWRAQHHVGSEMLTTRVIGCIETICVQHFMPKIVKQPANIAKEFCTDKKLKAWGFYRPGERHARDAIRHGAYYLVFGAIRKADKAPRTVG